MSYEKTILSWYEEFHTIPEVAWKEDKTTEKIAAILEDLGVNYHRFSDMTGLIGEMGEGNEVIAVRADIDALWQEVDGVWQGNHSCGHDANISMVLGAILYLKDQTLNKKIRFIFQPAEEKGEGAVAMMDKGALEQVTHLFGVHLRPIEELPVGKVSASIQHGAHVTLEGKIGGIDAHAARPHQGKNAIDVVMDIHHSLKSIYLSPSESYSAKLTKVLAGGESTNIIPGSAEFAIDIRAQKNEVLKEIKIKVEKIISHLEEFHEVSIKWEWSGLTPAAEISHEAEKIAEEAILSVVGKESLAPMVVTPGGDDFHFYTVKHPHLKATMIGIGADLEPGLHHPDMHFNTTVLDLGSRIIAETLIRA